MALLKIFTDRRKESERMGKKHSLHDLNLSNSSWKPPAFSRDQVRVLLFREGDGRSRKLLFDSASVKKTEPPGPQVPLPTTTSLVQRLRRTPTPTKSPSTAAPPVEGGKTDFMEVTQDGVVYQYLRPQSDVKMLGEMVFGSVAMSFAGTSTKIHTLRSPSQLMLTKVFPAPVPGEERDRTFSESFSSSSVDCIYPRPSGQQGRLSSSVGSADLLTSPEVPEWQARSCHEVECNLGMPSRLRSTSSLSSLMSPQASPDGLSSSLSHSGSYNSLQRRLQRYRTTSMEFGLPRTKWDEEGRVSSQKRTKLGMSVIFTLGDEDRQFHTFFFSHITLIESYVNKLRFAVEEAYLNRRSFVKLVMDGYVALQLAICDLYTAPRLPDPVWLRMMSGQDQHPVCLQFITEFMRLVEDLDLKSTQFFVSTLLTAVLSHHLAWVPTVTPPGIPPSNAYHEKHTAKWLHMLAKSHPYNPLWVQLGDLYGAVGFPCKTARTVIRGKKPELVRRFLYVLSYFIRCSEVYENLEQRVVNEPLHTSPCATAVATNTTDTSSQEGESVEIRDIPQLERTCDKLAPDSGSSPGMSSGSCELCSQLLVLGSSSTCKAVSVRPGRKYCNVCREVLRCTVGKNGVRNGCVFPDSVSPGRNESGIQVGRSTDSWKSLDNKTIDRDSGIDGCSTEETHPRLATNESATVISPPKVLFSIGDIPLKEICCTEDVLINSTPPTDFQRVLLHRGSMNGTVSQRLFVCQHAGKQVALADCVGLKKQGLTKSVSIGKNLAAQCSVEDDTSELALLVKNNSLACDSGIQSSEPSGIDVKHLVTEEMPSPGVVTAVKLNIPPILIEHECHVGHARNCRRNGVMEGEQNNLVTDFIGLPEEIETLLKRNCGPSTKGCENGLATLQQLIGAETKTTAVEWLKDYQNLKMVCGRTNGTQQHKHLKAGENGAVPEMPCAQKRSAAPWNVLCQCKLNGKNCQCRSQSEENLTRTDETQLRARHWSEASSLSKKTSEVPWSDSTFILMAKELPLPQSEVKQAINSTAEYFRGFAWSLIANHTDHYLADFALQGTADAAFHGRLCSDLKIGVQQPVLDERVAEAVCIIADTDTWSVQVTSDKTCTSDSTTSGSRVGMSQLVANMTETLLHLWKLKMSPEFCLMHLEDRLQEIYFKSRLLAEYLLDKSSSDIDEVTSTLNLDASDLPLLLSVASTHSPPVTLMYGVPYR